MTNEELERRKRAADEEQARLNEAHRLLTLATDLRIASGKAKGAIGLAFYTNQFGYPSARQITDCPQEPLEPTCKLIDDSELSSELHEYVRKSVAAWLLERAAEVEARFAELQ